VDPLNSDERALLEQVKSQKKLVPDGVDAARLDALAARGLLKSVSIGRGKLKQPAFSVSPEGTKALKWPPKARAKRSPAATVDDLAAMEARLHARLDALAQALGPPPQPPAYRTGAAPIDLAAAIAPALREADLAGRHGGLVPIPEVRKLALARSGATRAEFDEALLLLEREFKVDLKIANDPSRADASEGIAVPGRGLVYFALSK